MIEVPQVSLPVSERRDLFARILRNRETWADLIELKGPDLSVLDFGGEEFFFWDLDTGVSELSDDERELYELALVRDLSSRGVIDALGWKRVRCRDVDLMIDVVVVKLLDAYDRK